MGPEIGFFPKIRFLHEGISSEKIKDDKQNWFSQDILRVLRVLRGYNKISLFKNAKS